MWNKNMQGKSVLNSRSNRYIIELLLVWVACNISLSEGLIVRAGTVPNNNSHSSNNNNDMASSLLLKQTLRRNSAVSSIRMSTSSSSTLSNDLTGKKKKKVAIIGAGAAGLATARVFTRTFVGENDELELLVLEKEPKHAVGGIWNYAPNSKTKPVYRGLKTNLPKEIMAYREKPWLSNNDDDASFVTHQQVLSYLHEYATDYNLQSYISHGCEVTQLSILPQTSTNINNHNGEGEEKEILPQIQLDWTETTSSVLGDEEGEGKFKEESRKVSDIFDVVCVCNGHYAASSIPSIPGLDKFRGKIVHSIEYDDPSEFHGKTVLCVGGRASGADLAREISFHAKQVYLSDTTCPASSTIPASPTTGDKSDDDDDNHVLWVPKTLSITFDDQNDNAATIHLEGGATISCNEEDEKDFVIVFCSGYDYNFPFINEKSNLSFQDDHGNIHDMSVTPGERRVMPLYEQLWHAKYTNLAFVGLPHSVVPFPFFELQAEAIVAQLQLPSSEMDTIRLPPYEQRLKQAIEDSKAGGPKSSSNRVQDTHFLGDFQWDACRKYSRLAGNYNCEIENYIATNKAIYDHAGKQRKGTAPGGPDTYRYNKYTRIDDEKTFEVVLSEGETCNEKVTK